MPHSAYLQSISDHTHELADVLAPSTPLAAPTMSQLADLQVGLAFANGPVSHGVRAAVFLDPAQLLIARLSSLGATVTAPMAAKIRHFYNYALSVGLLKPALGGNNFPGANMLVTVWPTTAKQANLVDWLDPWGPLASYVTNTGAAADGSTMNMPGGEIGQLSANGHVIEPPNAGTARTLYGGALTETSSGTPTSGIGWVIMDNSDGADFIPSGAANNNTGTVFTANGAAPTWGTGKLQRAYIPQWCDAYYCRTAPGAANENFGGGRTDAAPYPSESWNHRFFHTTSGGSHLFSPGWLSGSFSVGSNGGARGLMLISLDADLACFTWRRHTRAGGLTLVSAASVYTDTYGMSNKPTPFFHGGYNRGGATETLHSEPWSLRYTGKSFHGDTSHTGANLMAKELHDITAGMALAVNANWVPA